MTIEDRLARIEVRQEALVSSVNGLTDVMQQTRDLVVELMGWLQQPASSDLADTLQTMLKAMQAQTDQMRTIGATLTKLPAQLARVVKTGDAS